MATTKTKRQPDTYSVWRDALALLLVILAGYSSYFVAGWAEQLPDLDPVPEVMIYDGWILTPEDLKVILDGGCDTAGVHDGSPSDAT